MAARRKTEQSPTHILRADGHFPIQCSRKLIIGERSTLYVHEIRDPRYVYMRQEVGKTCGTQYTNINRARRINLVW